MTWVCPSFRHELTVHDKAPCGARISALYARSSSSQACDRFRVVVSHRRAQRRTGRAVPDHRRGASVTRDMALARILSTSQRTRGPMPSDPDLRCRTAHRTSRDEWRQRLRPRNLTLEHCEELQERCRSRGLLFLATAHDESRIDWLKRLDVPAVKIGSGERNNPLFVRALASLGKPVILSTGMYREDDVRQALEACLQGGCSEVALLHCVTAYPSPDADLNLRAMDVLSRHAPCRRLVGSQRLNPLAV